MQQDIDPDFGTALDAAAAIRTKKISSVELAQHAFRRIDAFQPRLNAYLYQLRDEALAAAAAADDATARGTATGALHGVPVASRKASASKAARRTARPRARHLNTRPEQFMRGALSSFADCRQENMRRLAYRSMWEAFFETLDVFLLPTTFTAAFPHDQTHPDGRTIPLPEGGAQDFWNLLSYISPATLTGCPATTLPAGLGRSGLPIGFQVMGPYLEDTTPIAFAQLLAQDIGGFQAPPGYGL